MATEMMKPNANNGPVGGAGREPRYDFSKIRTSVRIPNLIEVQRESYDRFLQMDLLPPERDNTGLRWNSSNTASATGSASAASCKGCITCAPTVASAAR